MITLFLLRWSGVGPLESQLKRSKSKYVDYIASTSGFLPLPRRQTTDRPISQPTQPTQKAGR